MNNLDVNNLMTGSTYVDDYLLFDKLKLKRFKYLYKEEYFVGEVKEKEYSVKIFVNCLPSQFWRFEIIDVNNKHFQLSSGSGCLSDFWPSIELLAKNMLAIKKLVKK